MIKELKEMPTEELKELLEDDHDCDTPSGGGCSVCLEAYDRGLIPDDYEEGEPNDEPGEPND